MEVVADDEPPAQQQPDLAAAAASHHHPQQQQQHLANHQHYPQYPKHDSNGGGGGGGGGGRLGSRGNGSYEGGERRMVDITRDKPIKVAVRVQVPVRDHPKFNFVGKLLGPKGNSLKRLQEDTMCKMAVLGRGSMKDRQKEEELRVSGDPKFSHLMEDLHVEISAYATPAEAHARIAYALAEVRRFLVPDYNDDIRQEQMWEMQILNTQSREGQGVVEAPLSPASSLEAANSPTAATTANSIDGQEDAGATRPTPSPPHPQACSQLKAQPGTVLPAAVSSSLAGGRKRPLLPGARPAMSPTKRTVMSLLARARAAQNKDPLQQSSVSIVGPTTVSHQPVAASPLIQAALQQLPTGPASAAAQPSAQQVGQQASPLQQQLAQSLQTQRQPLMQSHTQHQVLAPAIHGLLHAQRAAAGATVLPILREDFMAGVNQHQVPNVHIA